MYPPISIRSIRMLRRLAAENLSPASPIVSLSTVKYLYYDILMLVKRETVVIRLRNQARRIS